MGLRTLHEDKKDVYIHDPSHGQFLRFNENIAPSGKWENQTIDGLTDLGISGYSGQAGVSGYSGISGYSGFSGDSGISGYSGYSGIGTSGYSGAVGQSGYSGQSGFSGDAVSGYSGISGYSGDSGISGYSGSGISGYSGSGVSGYSGESGYSGYSGDSTSGYSGYSGQSGWGLRRCWYQEAHGLSVLDVVRFHETDHSICVKAQADSYDHAEAIGVVDTVVDENNFCVTLFGEYINEYVPGMASTGELTGIDVGVVLFLSKTTPGGLTTQEPTEDGDISKPMAIIIDPGQRMLVYHLRGIEIVDPSLAGYSGYSGYSGAGGTGGGGDLNIDGGHADSVYGGTPLIDGGNI